MKKEKFRFVLNNQLFGDGEPAPNTATEGDSGNNLETTPTHETVDKKLFDKALKEKAELKRQLTAKQTEDEKRAEEQAEKELEIEELRKFKVKSELENGLLKGGINQNDVEAISKAILSGETDSISNVLCKVINETIENTKKTLESELLSNTPRPNGAGVNSEPTLDDYKKMDLDARTALKTANPELYEKFKNA